MFSRFTRSCVHRFLISGPDLRIDARFSPFTSSCVHRFLISSPDLRIDACFSSFTPSFVHRFLISSPDLRIDARFSPFTRSFVHRFLISSPNLRIDVGFCLFMHFCVHRFLISGPNLRITAGFRLQRLLQQRTFASNSNFRRVKEEWPACCDRSGDDVPRPILIFVAAKENSSACYGRSGTRFRVRLLFPLPQQRIVSPAAFVAASACRV